MSIDLHAISCEFLLGCCSSFRRMKYRRRRRMKTQTLCFLGESFLQETKINPVRNKVGSFGNYTCIIVCIRRTHYDIPVKLIVIVVAMVIDSN